jgi:L-ascorbate metabolism protein UlaG (beta-lactamase superfamily)
MLEALGSVDVLLVPVGGGNSLNAAQAAEVVAQVTPRIVIPMHYRQDGLKRELETEERFVKEMGAADVQPQPKLTLLGSSGAAEDTRVVLLARAGG